MGRISRMRFYVDDLLRIDEVFWEVVGIHLGTTHQESVVEVHRIGVKPPAVYNNTDAVCIPIKMLEEAIYSRAIRLYRRRIPTTGEDDG